MIKRKLAKAPPKNGIQNFVDLDDWPEVKTNGYLHREHARWAEVFNFLGFKFEYRKNLVTIDMEQSMRPTFLVLGKFWFHCCQQLSKNTQLMASAAAWKSELPVAIAAGRMFIPCIDAPLPWRIAYPIWFTFDQGCNSTKYFSDFDGDVSLRKVDAVYLTTPRLREAFSRGVLMNIRKSKAVSSHYVERVSG